MRPCPFPGGVPVIPPCAGGSSMSQNLWAIRKIEEATVEAYAASTPKEQREGDLVLAVLHLALHAPAEPEFCCHG